MTDEPNWRCTRCAKVQPFVVDRPCSCGCWWLTRENGDWKHVGGPDWWASKWPEQARLSTEEMIEQRRQHVAQHWGNE